MSRSSNDTQREPKYCNNFIERPENLVYQAAKMINNKSPPCVQSVRGHHIALSSPVEIALERKLSRSNTEIPEASGGCIPICGPCPASSHETEAESNSSYYSSPDSGDSVAAVHDLNAKIRFLKKKIARYEGYLRDPRNGFCHSKIHEIDCSSLFKKEKSRPKGYPE